MNLRSPRKEREILDRLKYRSSRYHSIGLIPVVVLNIFVMLDLFVWDRRRVNVQNLDRVAKPVSQELVVSLHGVEPAPRVPEHGLNDKIEMA
jgi:hypothetical protein